MPCYDYSNENTRTVYVESGKQTARLCAVFTVLEKQGLLAQTLAQCDWKEAGVDLRNTVNWWENHKEEGRQRKDRERANRIVKDRNEKLVTSALDKLTAAEAKALGVTRFGHKK